MAEETDLLKRMKKAGFTPEVAEIKRDYFDYTGYPQSAKKYSLSFKSKEKDGSPNIEEMYFWMLGHATNDWSMPFVHKITDIFAASQSSSTFGDIQARLNATQNQASQLLQTTSAMSKDLFKRVREFRQIRERLGYYKLAEVSKKFDERKSSSEMGAENTLKDAWVTLVEGGSESPGSVYGMARKVGFTVLPDLFFQAPPLEVSEVKSYVKTLEFNPTVLLALERKLYQFITWKSETYKELVFKERFQKKLIYQHYQNMKMYLNWIKPYLKNISKLNMDSDLMNTGSIISSFQTSMMEIEVLVQKPFKQVKFGKDSKESETFNSVVIMHFLYETQPSFDYHSKDSWQQKGPIHVGRVDATIRAYGWSNKEIAAYKKMKEDEEIGMLESIDYTLKSEAELLGDDLKQILDEIGKDLNKKLYGETSEAEKTPEQLMKEEKEKLKKMRKEALTPFTGIGSGIKELFIDPFFDVSGLFSGGDVDKQSKEKKEAKGGAEKHAQMIAWQIYKNYKKAHRMVTW